jgi:hypothetical protein
MDLEYCASLAILTRKAWHWAGWDPTCPLLLLRVFGETGGRWGHWGAWSCEQAGVKVLRFRDKSVWFRV